MNCISLIILFPVKSWSHFTNSNVEGLLTIRKPSSNLLMNGTWQPFGTPGLATLPTVGHAQGTWHQNSMRSGTHYN